MWYELGRQFIILRFFYITTGLPSISRHVGGCCVVFRGLFHDQGGGEREARMHWAQWANGGVRVLLGFLANVDHG